MAKMNELAEELLKANNNFRLSLYNAMFCNPGLTPICCRKMAEAALKTFRDMVDPIEEKIRTELYGTVQEQIEKAKNLKIKKDSEG